MVNFIKSSFDKTSFLTKQAIITNVRLLIRLYKFFGWDVIYHNNKVLGLFVFTNALYQFRVIIVLTNPLYFSPRHCHGLVWSRALVAQPQLVADQDQVHTGPVWRAGRLLAALHSHAQDATCAAARPEVLGLSRGLLYQDVQRRASPVQGVGWVNCCNHWSSVVVKR